VASAMAPLSSIFFFECLYFTLFLIFLSVEALFRTSVLNRHNRVYIADPMLSEIRSTPCACGALCAHRAPHAQGVLYVCCKQMLKIAMDALVTGFCCSSTVTSINLLETHKIVDLLADREAESVQKWLEAHPEVEIVSRDRGGTYVDGATQGAPLATQVCDRWHILKNLGEAVEGFLIRTRLRLPDAKTAEPTPERPFTSYSATPAGQGKSQARLLRKWKLYQQVQELHAQGMSLRAIADHLNLARNTVRKYVRQPPEPPLPTPRPLRASPLDRYEDSILKRWGQGC
jgi:Transposase/Helix-turn-helix domain